MAHHKGPPFFGACVAALLVISCGGRGDLPAPAATATPAVSATLEATSQPIVIIPLGRTARDETAEITVHGVRRSDSEGGEPAPAGFEWLLVEVSVNNVSSLPFALQVRLRDGDGVSLDRAYPVTTEPALDAPISAGSGLRGEIAFLAPRGMLGGALIYGPGEERWALQLGSIRTPE